MTDSSFDNGRPDQFVTQATSGASGTNVGIAGSVAANIISAGSSAAISNGATVTIDTGGTGALAVTSDNEMATSATAAPVGTGASGGKVGVGASVALNTITETSSASIDNGVDVDETTSSAAVSANSATNTASFSTGGASGGIAVDAVVALSLLSKSTTATIGTGNSLGSSGALSVTAVSAGANTATAIGKTDTSGGSGSGGSGSSSGVGVGASVALITGLGVIDAATSGDAITSTTTASLARDVDVGGDLTVSAQSTRSYDTESTAIAGGAVFSQAMQGGDATTSSGGSAASVDTLNSKQAQGAMSQESSASGSGSSGKLSVAAAIGASIEGDDVTAQIVGGSSAADQTLSVGGSVQVSATYDGDVLSLGDGATVGNQKVGSCIVGLGFGVLDDWTQASIGDSRTSFRRTAPSPRDLGPGDLDGKPGTGLRRPSVGAGDVRRDRK